jgi:L-amino acid N-acyltransferase
VIRDATDADLGDILDIYNVSIGTTATWSEQLQSFDERLAWFRERQAADEAVLVAVDHDQVVGFAAYGPFRDNDLWPGYRFTVENTVHVRATHQGLGLGRALMEALLAHATRAGRHAVIAAVDAENTGSIAFHTALGFEEVGRLPEIGWKFGRWLDLVLMQRTLT